MPRPMSSARQMPKPNCSWKAIHDTPRLWYGRSVPWKLLGVGITCNWRLDDSLLRKALSHPVAAMPTTGTPLSSTSTEYAIRRASESFTLPPGCSRMNRTAACTSSGRISTQRPLTRTSGVRLAANCSNSCSESVVSPTAISH